MQDIANPITFSAYKNTGSFIHAGSYIDSYVQLLTDNSNSFDLITGIFTVPRDGVYDFYAAAYHQTNGANAIAVMKNGNRYLSFWSSAYTGDSNDDTLSFNWMMELEKGDFIGLQVLRGAMYCDNNANCIFNGKFVRNKLK